MNVCSTCYKITFSFIVILICCILQYAICIYDHKTLSETRFQVINFSHNKVAATNINPNYVAAASNRTQIKRLKRDYWRPRLARKLPQFQSINEKKNEDEGKERKKRGSFGIFIYTSKTERVPYKSRIPSRMKYNKFGYPSTLGALFAAFVQPYEIPWELPWHPAFYTEAYRQVLRWGQRMTSFASTDINFMKTTQLTDVSDKFLMSKLPTFVQRLVFYITKKNWDSYYKPPTGMNVIPETQASIIKRRRKANVTFAKIQPKWGRRRPSV